MIGSLDVRVKEAGENELGYIEFLNLILQDELNSRESNILGKRIRSASFPSQMTFERFDFNFNRESLPPAFIRDLSTCRFVERLENLVLCGPPGIGKSHIASSIGHEACRRQMDVIFRKTSKLIEELSDILYPKRRDRFLKKCVSCHLLILDDFAFRKYSQKESEILYTIADERLGKRSTIITSNRPPEDWFSVFPDPVIGGAILDRLVSGAIKLIDDKGKSHRKEKILAENHV
jgi:DNA replication protein DnaC